MGYNAETMTTDDRRPDADRLLAQASAELEREGRGRLRVFLGYAAGVGKTYAMLQAARQRQAEGVDVLAGYVETHGRAETQALMAGLEAVPARHVEYRGTILREPDVDAVLARHPALVLIDELAHTNAPGLRHPKRHQDVSELLAAGISVYTTLNVQHLESLNDAVAQVTGITVRETVPDRLLDEADEIELVDLPPAELLQRLAEGKVYVPDQAALAVERFFREGNLAALREMALRRTAARVDEQMRSYMQMRAIPGPWPVAERLLVCVGPGPLSARLLRAGRRLADELKAEWFALHVRVPDGPGAGEATGPLAENLRLAEELGAAVAMRTAPVVADAVVAFARDHNVTKIVVGKPLQPRWVELLRGSIVDHIIRRSGELDVYVINSAGEDSVPRAAAGARGPVRPRPYLLSAAVVVAATLAGWPVHQVIHPANLVMLYLVAVGLCSLHLGRGPSVFASALSVILFDFFFVEPRFTFTVDDTQYVLTFLGLFSVGLVVSALVTRVKRQAEVARKREAETYEVYTLSRDLATAATIEDIAEALVTRLGQAFGLEAVLLLPAAAGGSGALGLQAPDGRPDLEEEERAVAQWAFDRGRAAGAGTDTLPGAAMHYVPMVVAGRSLGVVGVRGKGTEWMEPLDRRRLLEAFVSQAALAVERVRLAEQANEVEVLSATEKLQTALLNSVSHELRTPLATITGVLSSLLQDADDPVSGGVGGGAMHSELLETAWEEARRLNRLVGNLLDMSRLQAGALSLRSEPCDLQDIVGVSLAQLADRIGDRAVDVDLPADLPLVPLDAVLIVQVLANLLDNALKYSPADTPIGILGRLSGERVLLEVSDRGPGIPPEDLDDVFRQFQRLGRDEKVTGTGLGLAISKGIVEAHGGSVWARNRAGGGTTIGIALPVRPCTPKPAEEP